MQQRAEVASEITARLEAECGPIRRSRDELFEARRAGRILGVEGETDSAALVQHSMPHLDLPGSGTWRSEWATCFEGVDEVFVWAEPGPAPLQSNSPGG